MKCDIEDQSWKFDVINGRYPLNSADLVPNSITAESTLRRKFLSTNKKYKYKPNTKKHNIKNLEDDTLWLAYSYLLNDPFECDISIGENKSLIDENIQPGPKCCFEDIESVIDKSNPLYTYYHAILLRKMETELRPSFNDAKSNFAICSLTELRDSILMWSHYANQHEGFCVEYDAHELLNMRQNELFPIIYDSYLPDFTLTSTMDHMKENIANIIARSHLTKAKDWSYEQEWRLLSSKNITSDSKGFTIEMPKPTGIYLGCKISDCDRNTLLDLCNKRGIKVFQMVRIRNKYELAPTDISMCHKNESRNEWELNYTYIF